MVEFTQIVEKLTAKGKTIASMESCTGGGFSNAVTNVAGASEVLKFSAVTYSNEYKIKMGVSEEVIDCFTVYSIETAKEMSKSISDFACSNYGVGITGQLRRVDSHNAVSNDNLVYVSIYNRDTNDYITLSMEVTEDSRTDNKQLVINHIAKVLLTIL